MRSLTKPYNSTTVMYGLTLTKPYNSTTVLNYKYPKYHTIHFTNGEIVDGPLLSVSIHWNKGKYTYYKLYYREFELLHVFWVKALRNNDLPVTLLCTHDTATPLHNYYITTANH